MKRALVAVALMGAVVVLAGPVVIAPTATEVEMAPCNGAGESHDAGNTQGKQLGSAPYLFRVTGSDAYLCLYDGGALSTGCNDGGACVNCASGGKQFPQGSMFVWTGKQGGTNWNCRSDGGASVHFTPLSATP